MKRNTKINKALKMLARSAGISSTMVSAENLTTQASRRCRGFNMLKKFIDEQEASDPINFEVTYTYRGSREAELVIDFSSKTAIIDKAEAYVTKTLTEAGFTISAA